MPPKHKISGLDYVELEQTLESSKKHRRFISGTEAEGEDAGEASTETLDRLIDRMKSKLSGPQVSMLALWNVQGLTFFRHPVFLA